MTYELHSTEEMESFAKNFVSKLKPGEQATIIGLQGELGAGKTSFVQAVARALGVNGHVASPTFTLEKRYELTGMPFATLIHIDAYRLKNAEELKALRFLETLQNPGNIIFIEWAERVAELLPRGTTFLSFEALPGGERRITKQ